MNYGQILALIGQVLGQSEAFLAGQAVTITIPIEAATISLGALGPVTVSESGVNITLKKGV